MTAAAALVVLVMVAAGALLFQALLDASLADAEHSAAQDTAEAFAERGEGAALDDDAIAQLQRGGAVLDQTAEAAELGLVLPAQDGARILLDDEPHVLAVEETEAGVAVAARSLESAAEATGATALLLLGAVPLVTALVAAIVWVVAGRALRPVERLRREVEAVRAEDPTQRVAAPRGAGELDALAATMNELLDRIETSQRAQRQFVADASHELRSPIASLRQHAEVASAYPRTTDLAELAGLVDLESSRLAALVDDLLLLARSGEPAAMRREPLDLDDLVLDEGARLRALGGIEVTADASPTRLHGDPGLLARALRNLGDNARRHARARIALSLEREGDAVLVRVDDDGAGIAPDDRERIFERFVRLDAARAREDGGAGLGLAIVAEAAARHGGSVTASSSPLGGARLELRLPLA
ncbi:sensor histidine kinase [Homoserinibacter sp. YIM 151385]|uniref:sensor histidine kinase n=1 Tax=Homoserinibacter sp. YIM 151385 TaxID=2985506 RepID=UPI0022F04E8F|nr:ATP-binding protein [Homoserinibacter sp. YIM 151385]WBU37500.1 ATP-binding protein [Homoserinibacter sp. YIM 151385]